MTAPSRVAPGPPVFYGWVVLMASVAIIAVGTGTIFSLAVFLRPLEEDFGWTRSLISGVAFVNWVIFGVGSFVAGVVSDRIGARRVVAVGAALLGAALVASSQIRTAAQLYVAFGVIGALGASAFYVPLSATATRWFAARRGLAMGIISSGMGLGILVVPPTARALITALGLAGDLRRVRRPHVDRRRRGTPVPGQPARGSGPPGVRRGAPARRTARRRRPAAT